MLVEAIIFVITNITLFFLYFAVIIIIIIAIVSIVTFVILIFAIILFKSITYKILNISSITIIVYYDKRSKLKRKFLKHCYCNKQHEFQLVDCMTYPLNSSNKLVFAYITKS